MGKILVFLLACCLWMTSSPAQDINMAKLENLSSYFTGEKKYLVLPVKNGAPKRNIELWVDGDKVRYLNMEVADGEADWLAYMDISEWKGKQIEIRVDKLPVGSKAFAPVRQNDEDVNDGVPYQEELRGQFHFSPKRGWTNDPNGMVYYNKEYHLFFQHNPYGRTWGNMTWGHAVSPDMVHWKEVGDALHPDKFGTMFSGSAVVDSANSSGLGTSNKPPMVLFFTGAGSWAQGIAYSTDGRTFTKLAKAAVPRINKDNRDPKVVWHEPTKKWIMVLYVERDSGLHTMQFLTSPDLKNWTEASVVKGGKGNDRYLFECPEFFELPVDGNESQKKWVLTGANSEYAIGRFDGITFTPETERLNGQLGRDFYAAQTFSNEPTGRRIEMGWWRTHTDKGDMTFNQSMSIPMELKLVSTPEGLRLTRTPVRELESLRIKSYSTRKKRITPSSQNLLSTIDIELAEIRAQIDPGSAKEITLTVRGLPVVYNVAKQELLVDNVSAHAPLTNGKLHLTVYADRTGLEIFANDGLMFMPINKNLDAENRKLELFVQGGNARVLSLDVHQLESIWPSPL